MAEKEYIERSAVVNGLRAAIKKYSDDITIFPGHGEDSTLGYEKKNNIFLNE